MGVRLLNEVLDHAPEDLTQAELLVLLVLAENARDATRECWPGSDFLVRRTRMQPRGIRQAIARIEARGYQVRVPLGKDKHGREFYAATGQRTKYRVPEFEVGGTLMPPKAAPPFPQRGHENVDKAARGGRKGGTVVPPFPSGTVRNPQSRGNAVSLLAAVGADERETEAFIKKIKSERHVRNVDAYVATLAENGDLANLLEQVRLEQKRQADDDALRQGWICHRCRNRNRTDRTECRQCGTAKP
jgi:ribosomal protein L40E